MGQATKKTIQKLINIAKSNSNVFLSKEVLFLCEKANSEISTNYANTIMKIKIRRDQDLSHNDPLFFYGEINPAEKTIFHHKK